jgi:hypothetical protein
VHESVATGPRRGIDLEVTGVSVATLRQRSPRAETSAAQHLAAATAAAAAPVELSVTTAGLPARASLAAAVRVDGAAALQQRALDQQLPTAHVCFFALRLPRQADDAVMRRNLLFAVHNCVAMDADYRVSEREVGDATDWDP